MRVVNRKAFVTSLMLIVSVAALTLILTGESSPEPSVFVSPPSIAVNVNQTFELDINVSEASDLYGWEFKLGWNPTLLDVVNVTENSFLSTGGETYIVSKVNNVEGYILVGCTLLRNITGVNGNGTAATVEFKAERAGSTTLDLHDTKLVSSQKQQTSHNSIDGTVTIPSTPVGGIYIPVNKLELLAPYIGLTILLAVAVVTVVYVKKRKRELK